MKRSSDTVGEALWTGTASVGQEVNRDVTTRLPIGEALQGHQLLGMGLLAAGMLLVLWDSPALAPA